MAAVVEYIWVLEESNCSAVYVEKRRAYEWHTEFCKFTMAPLTCLQVNKGYDYWAGAMNNCRIETSVPYDGFFLRTYANENTEIYINEAAATMEFPDSVLQSHSVKLPWGFKVCGHPEDKLVHIYGRGGSYFVFFPMVPVETQIITIRFPFCIGSQKHEFSFVFRKEQRDMKQDRNAQEISD